MDKSTFEDFLSAWTEHFFEADSDSPSTFMKDYFEDRKDEFDFSKDQLQEIAALIGGFELEGVILLVGCTEISFDFFANLASITSCLKEIQTTYQVSDEQRRLATNFCQHTTLTEVLSTDDNLLLEVDETPMVLNSSHHLKEGKEARAPLRINIDNALIALRNAQQALEDIVKNNQSLASEIAIKLGTKPKHCNSLVRFYKKTFKKISGTNSCDIPLDIRQDIVPGLITLKEAFQEDADRYKPWGNIFKTLVSLFKKEMSSAEVIALTHHIDKYVLLFADFVAVCQNDTHQFYEEDSESLNSEEIRKIRTVTNELITNAASKNYHFVNSTFNASSLTTSVQCGKNILCNATLTAKHIITVLDLITEKLLTSKDSQAHQSQCTEALELILSFCNACVFGTHQPMKVNRPLADYSTISRIFGPTYASGLKMAESLNAIGIENNDLNVTNESLINLNKFITSPDFDIQGSKAFQLVGKIIETLSKGGNNTITNEGLNSWLSTVALPVCERGSFATSKVYPSNTVFFKTADNLSTSQPNSHNLQCQ